MGANFTKSQNQATNLLAENCVIRYPVSVIDICDEYGIEVFEADLEDGVSGKLLFNEKTIIVNRKDGRFRQRFTIAHELGHYFLHRDLPEFQIKEYVERSNPIGREEKPDYEKEADAFAAHLLVPFSLLQTVVNESVQDLSIKFQVSPAVVSYQLQAYERKI